MMQLEKKEQLGKFFEDLNFLNPRSHLKSSKFPMSSAYVIYSRVQGVLGIC